VAVAVLLDNFIQASAQIEDEEKVGALSQQREMARVPHPLDPIMEHLSQDYIDDEDLSRRIRDLFKVGCPAAVGPIPAPCLRGLGLKFDADPGFASLELTSACQCERSDSPDRVAFLCDSCDSCVTLQAMDADLIYTIYTLFADAGRGRVAVHQLRRALLAAAAARLQSPRAHHDVGLRNPHAERHPVQRKWGDESRRIRAGDATAPAPLRAGSGDALRDFTSRPSFQRNVKK
jgi:hypothetical protein